MSMKLFSAVVFTCLLPFGAMAQDSFMCTREGSTRSYAIEFDAYQNGRSNFAIVKKIQYPTENSHLYKMVDAGASKIDLINNDLQFQVDRKLTFHGDKSQLEVTWIVGCTGFCTGGSSGTIMYDCVRN